jgi:hypothetical protein
MKTSKTLGKSLLPMITTILLTAILYQYVLKATNYNSDQVLTLFTTICKKSVDAVPHFNS